MTSREKIIELRKTKPYATLKEIGDSIGVSKERVRQILKKENLPTTHIKIVKINELDVPSHFRNLEYKEIWEALIGLKDGQALQISQINQSELSGIKVSFRKLGHKVIQRKDILYIIKGKNVNEEMVANKTSTIGLTTIEASRELRVHPNTLMRWVKDGKVPFIRLGKRKVIFSRKEIEQLVNKKD